jgi:adenosylmethionine-8-amino-7-oxononanoate aminotransferase
VSEVRGLGLLVGVEIGADRETRAPFPDGRGCATARRHCLQDGLTVRAISDTIALSPPLVISESEVDHVADIVSAAVQKAETELARR